MYLDVDYILQKYLCTIMNDYILCNYGTNMLTHQLLHVVSLNNTLKFYIKLRFMYYKFIYGSIELLSINRLHHMTNFY